MLMKFLKAIKLKPLDFGIIVLLFAASFSVLLLLPKQAQGATAQVRVHGHVIKTFNLHQNQTWTYRSEDGEYNVVKVENARIRVIKANCKDQIDVKAGWISHVGQTIVCLPHSFVIQVMSGKTNPEVDYSE